MKRMVNVLFAGVLAMTVLSCGEEKKGYTRNGEMCIRDSLLADPSLASDELICRITGITSDELAKAHEINKSRNTPQGMMAMMIDVYKRQDYY